MDWLATHVIAIVGALLSALCAAIGIVVRQAAVQKRAASRRESAPISTSWVREPSWWAGTLAAVAGYVFQAIALSHGSLLLVQPLLMSSLLFVLPLAAFVSGQRVPASEWWWAVVLTSALAVFVLVGQPREGHYRPPVPAWTVALVVTVPLVVGCVIAAGRVVGRSRAILLAATVAVLLGMIAVLTKVSAHRFAVGGWHGLFTVPAPYLLVVLAVGVTVLQQSAFGAGSLQEAVPIMLVGEPVVAVLLGVVILGEHLSVHGPAILILAIAVGLMVAATVSLARKPVSRTTSDADEARATASRSNSARRSEAPLDIA